MTIYHQSGYYLAEYLEQSQSILKEYLKIVITSNYMQIINRQSNGFLQVHKIACEYSSILRWPRRVKCERTQNRLRAQKFCVLFQKFLCALPRILFALPNFVCALPTLFCALPIPNLCAFFQICVRASFVQHSASDFSSSHLLICARSEHLNDLEEC